MAVHDLRYLLAYGPGARQELVATGHSYLHELTPWVVLVLALGLGALLLRLRDAWRRGRPDHGRSPRPLALWAVAAAGLLAIYAGQELLEGFLATGHPTGLAGIVGDGGWWAGPASVAVGGLLALLVWGAHRVVALVARARRRPAPARRASRSRLRPHVVLLRAASPLARVGAGRAPPAARASHP